MTAQTKLSAKGQVVIPKDVRDRLGLVEGMVFDVVERDGDIVLKKEGAYASGLSGADALREIRTFYRYDGPPVSLQEMKDAARKAAVDHYLRKRDR
ncbi:MAG: AbrB/MazE/SpoVT family DNA-binding domain-containing protein [Novosphingobium sp.]